MQQVMAGQRGYTLVEIMVVMVIVGILSFFAAASYQSNKRATYRTEAMEALYRIADAQEFFHNAQPNPRSYTDDIADLAPFGVDNVSANGLYELSVDACPGQALQDCFVATATARAGRAQSNDASCQTFTLDKFGRQSSAPDPDACWRR